MVDLSSQVTDLTTKTLVKSIAMGVAERIAIIAGTWLVTNKLLPEDQLTGAETVIGTAVLALGVFAFTWWQEHGRFLLMKKLQMETPPSADPATPAQSA